MEKIFIPYKKKGRPTDRPDVKTLADLYQNNTAVEIAQMYGVSRNTVFRWLREYRKEYADE